MTAIRAARRPRLAVTTGCPAGIGPEVFVGALAELPVAAELVFTGSASILSRAASALDLPEHIVVTEHDDGGLFRIGDTTIRCLRPDLQFAGRPGHPDDEALRVQRASLLDAIALASSGEVDGIVTLPIRKASLASVEGGPWPGHTELLEARLSDGRGPAAMLFAGGPFVLGLATVHLPLREVASALTTDVIEQKLERLLEGLAMLRAGGDRSAAPRIAVLGLNPHAGEGGLLGNEDDDVIAPAVARLAARGIDVAGPLPADGAFARFAREAVSGQVSVDGVLAMFHDQGLAPYKVLAGGAGVNVTVGLRTVRTSPDHGTADDLAGTGRASVASTRRALEIAAFAVARARSGGHAG